MPNPTDPEDWLQWIFFAFAACIVLYQIASGWKRGMARQLVHWFALVIAYLAAWFGAREFVSMLRPLGYPDMVLSVLAGVGTWLVVFFVVTIFGVILFKKTSQQSTAAGRFSYGMSGGALGLISGLVFVWMALVVVRLVGAVAQSEITALHTAAEKHPDTEHPEAQKPNMALEGLAGLKHSLDTGVAGDIVRQVDPVPKKVYDMISKMANIFATPENARHFLDYPGAQTVISDPKFTALRDDPEIVKAIKDRNFLALLKNPHFVSVANDPALYPLLKKFEFEKALDYSAGSAQKDQPAPTP